MVNRLVIGVVRIMFVFSICMFMFFVVVALLFYGVACVRVCVCVLFGCWFCGFRPLCVRRAWELRDSTGPLRACAFLSSLREYVAHTHTHALRHTHIFTHTQTTD